MSEYLVLVGIVVAALSGVPGLFLPRHGGVGQKLATLLIAVGSALGLAGVAAFWFAQDSAELAFPWAIPGGEFRVGVDGLSALFLVPVFLISLLGSLYGLEYWKPSEKVGARKLQVFYGL